MKKLVKNFQEIVLSENKAYNSKGFDDFMSNKDEYQLPKTLGSNRIQQIMDTLQDVAYDLDAIVKDAGQSMDPMDLAKAEECNAALKSAVTCMMHLASKMD